VQQAEENAEGEGVFTGSPSKQTERLIAGLRAVRAVANLAHIDLDAVLGRLMACPSPPPRLARRLEVTRSEFAGMPVWTMRSPEAARSMDGHIVCLHGGAYVHEATSTHWRNYATIARDTGASVVVPVYPLAPRGTAVTVVPGIADLISRLVCEHGPNAVGIYGDSAGGGLALAASQELVRRGASVPARMVLVSPWLDVTMTEPGIDDINDPALDPAMLRRCGLQWAGGLDPAHPLVSPLFGSLAGLPTTAVYSGSLDVLCVDAIRLRANAIAEGVDMSFVLRRGLIHDWALSPLPEAVEVRPDIHRQLLHTA
jgi:triacylglycerol lipase